MARFQPRSNIYTFLPILATLVMAAGITFTWMKIQEYQQPPKPTDLPPAKGRQYPDPPAPPSAKKATDILDEPGKEKGEVAPGEKAPTEEPGEKAKAPDAPEVKEKAPAEKAPAEEPAPPKAKAEEEEK
ncbi:MAG TPA: hypothetical protein PLE19_21290 [Planctomycetota bacterium]|nr:hypothetical protein [Planctomycetota bacterium]HRR82669.1 hypothetical protein [Planctomycetota bacterium]